MRPQNLTVFALFVQFASVLMEMESMLLPLVLFCTVFGFERQSLGAERERLLMTVLWLLL